jgi:undecaprenyl pyrophosphate phosphatase UppP
MFGWYILVATIPAGLAGLLLNDWIEANLDLSAYKNKMQAMGAIMAHFGSSADGSQVKQVLQKISG